MTEDGMLIDPILSKILVKYPTVFKIPYLWRCPWGSHSTVPPSLSQALLETASLLLFRTSFCPEDTTATGSGSGGATARALVQVRSLAHCSL